MCFSSLLFGTTSACAENTIRALTGCFSIRNYLRVRGEYYQQFYLSRGFSELPPRARRIRTAVPRQGGEGGTTSACAENTEHAMLLMTYMRNYLRVRGEY